MKQNVNLMQHEADLNSDVFNAAQREYILQALANLGQRMGIKGDGLSYKSFSFYDILNNDFLTYSANEYVGYLEYNKDDSTDIYTGVFGLYNINTNTEKVLESLTTKSINNILYFDRQFSFTLPVNNIEKYAKGSIISNDNNILTIITVGKIAGYSDDDQNNSALLYYKFDILSNRLIYAAKLHHISSSNNSEYYALIRLNLKKDEDDVYINDYNLNIQIFNANVLDEIYRTSFISLFCFDNYKESPEMGFNILRPEFIDVDLLEGTYIYNDNTSNNFDANSPISIILNNEVNTNYYTNTNLNIRFDSKQNELLSIDDNFEEIITLYKNEYKFTNLEEDIYDFNSDINELYVNMFNYYNDKFYLQNRSALFKRILCKIYEELGNNEGRLYIPLNYYINYITNSNNELNIYYSTDIYVLLTNLNEKYNKGDYLLNNNYLVFDYDDKDVIKSFKFEVEYNYYIDNLINNVSIKPIYTMPYINDEENWNINGENTNIRAVGKDAGNPNIIIIYSKNKENTLSSYSVLNAIKDQNVIVKSEFNKERIKIDPKLFTGVTEQNIYCYAYVPVIDSTNKDAFENSIIINICDLNCLEEENYINQFIGSNIITIWYYGKIKKTYKFNLITEDDSDYALPLGATTNIASILENSIGSINAQDMVILKAKISKLAHESLGVKSLNWEILRNKTASEYVPSEENEEEFKYYNNLNAIIEYTDNLTFNGNTPEYSQNEKYINDFDNIETTNLLYPKYEIKENYIEGNVETIIEKIEEELVNKEIISINVNNEGDIIFSDEIRQMAESVIKPSTETHVVSMSYKTVDLATTETYNEFVFNSNVPTLDLKEIFVRNMNVLNRMNILSLDEAGNIYYAYFGTSYDEYNKSTLHIGSLNKNINIGSDTLIDEVNRESLNVHNQLSVDFANIYLNPEHKLYSHKSMTVEFEENNREYKIGKEHLVDKLYTEADIQITEENLSRFDANNTAIVIQSVVNSVNIDLTRIGVIQLGDDHMYQKEIMDNGLPNVYRPLETNPYNRFAVCINNIVNHLFNININEYDHITIFYGGNNMIVYRLASADLVPYFFILINDYVTNKNGNMIISADSLDVTCEKINDKEINIYIEFDKHNKIGYGWIVYNKPNLYINSRKIDQASVSPEETIHPYYWYCSIMPITQSDLSDINIARSINTIDDLESNDMGWRILCREMPNAGLGKIVWEGDNMYNCVVFPVDWGNFDNDGKEYYLVLPDEFMVRDALSATSIIDYEVVASGIQMLGHTYKILRSRDPWYEFAYIIYLP